jgi:hypothetical protein
MVDNSAAQSAMTASTSSTSSSSYSQKRTIDQISEQQQRQMKMKRHAHDISGDSDMNDSIDNMTPDDMFLPHVTINESPRFDTSSVKRESSEGVRPQSPSTAYRNPYREFLS